MDKINSINRSINIPFYQYKHTCTYTISSLNFKQIGIFLQISQNHDLVVYIQYPVWTTYKLVSFYRFFQNYDILAYTQYPVQTLHKLVTFYRFFFKTMLLTTLCPYLSPNLHGYVTPSNDLVSADL